MRVGTRPPNQVWEAGRLDPSAVRRLTRISIGLIHGQHVIDGNEHRPRNRDPGRRGAVFGCHSRRELGEMAGAPDGVMARFHKNRGNGVKSLHLTSPL
jgi:hypothetical protein